MPSGPRICSIAASVPGVKREWWCHTPSGYWFIVERDTARDEILATYDAAELAARAGA